MRCWSCGTAFELAAGERVGFRDACSGCGADLHACRGCSFHDPSAYNECREPSAERVSNRERANRCDHFAPVDRATGRAAAKSARAGLEELFKKR